MTPPQPTRRDRKAITRLVYWMNRGMGSLPAMVSHGYYVDTSERDNFREHRIGREGHTLAVLHEFEEETFAFFFTPQATAPCWRRMVWRAGMIGEALFYGLLPSRVYERERHYDCSYWRHAAMNLALAWRWATWRETSDDREFAAGDERPTGQQHPDAYMHVGKDVDERRRALVKHDPSNPDHAGDWYANQQDGDDIACCTHCGGEGLCFDGSDPLGNCPDDPHRCHACNGSGKRRDQTLF